TTAAAGYANVLRVTDPGSLVYAIVQHPDSRAIGLVDGLLGPYLTMRLIPQTAAVQRGDVILTSGRGPYYPKGVYIGRVLEVHKNNADAFQDAVVEPAAQLSRLESVL